MTGFLTRQTHTFPNTNLAAWAVRLAAMLGCIAAFTGRAAGQQNLFNMPSGDITPQGKVFYQHQFNLYSNKVESKAHFVYGLGRGWDAGLNLVGKGAYFTPEWRALYNDDRTRGAVYPILLATGQKQWAFGERFFANVGAQAGVNLSDRLTNKALNAFGFALAGWSPHTGHRIVAGPYIGSQMLLGTGNRAGVMLGFESHIWRGFYLMGDWYSGRNDAGVAVLGAMYTVGKRVQVCAGYGLPNPATPKRPALVLELNLLGWDYEHH